MLEDSVRTLRLQVVGLENEIELPATLPWQTHEYLQQSIEGAHYAVRYRRKREGR